MAYATWQELCERQLIRYAGPMIDDETPTFFGVPHARSHQDLKGTDVVIIGSSYVATDTDYYAGVHRDEWKAAAKRVRQQSAHYYSPYIVEFDTNVFEELRVVDYGDANLPEDIARNQSPENILRAQVAVEEKVGHVLDAGAIPIVIGQNSPCASYAIAKPIAERIKGSLGCVSLDAHWDVGGHKGLESDPRIAGGPDWKRKMYGFLDNMSPRHLVEIGERGMLEEKESVREFLNAGAHFIPTWKLRTTLGMDGLIKKLDHAYDGTEGVFVHFDMDVIGGAGPSGGDLLGELGEPLGLSDYEIIRIAHEIGIRGLSGMCFIAIPPGSEVMYRVIVYIIMYLLAGLSIKKSKA